jgi:phenylacetate-coenzyme A ligase PaaK-like adenylate-forming protein
MLTKAELGEIGLKSLEDAKRDNEAKQYLYRMTSGTVGNLPILILRKRSIVESLNLDFYARSTKVAGFFGSYNARLTHLNLSLLNDSESRSAIFLDFKDLDYNLDEILSRFSPDSLCGFPSFILKSLKYIKNRQVTGGIKSIRLIGEAVSPRKIEMLKSKFPNADIRLFYAAAEVGFISSYCPHLSIGQYHIRKNIKVEISEPDGHGFGQILISTNLSPSVEIKRYQTGDIGRLIKKSRKSCSCGNKEILEVLGRKDFDFIKLCGAILTQRELERVVLELNDCIVDFNGEVREVISDGTDILGEISLGIIPTQKLLLMKSSGDFLREEISKRLFLTATQTLDDLVRKGVFLPLRVTLKQELPFKHKDVKLRRAD